MKYSKEQCTNIIRKTLESINSGNINKMQYASEEIYDMIITNMRIFVADALEEHDNELIEKCAMVVNNCFCHDPMGAEALVEAETKIRALIKRNAECTKVASAEHDNALIERIAAALENAEGEFKTLPEYVALVRGMKND